MDLASTALVVSPFGSRVEEEEGRKMLDCVGRRGDRQGERGRVTTERGRRE